MAQNNFLRTNDIEDVNPDNPAELDNWVDEALRLVNTPLWGELDETEFSARERMYWDTLYRNPLK